jgi:hypothetical protein
MEDARRGLNDRRYRQEIMKPVNAAIATFFLTAVIGCLAIAFGYIAYADSTHTFDREGATGMAVVFFYAPGRGHRGNRWRGRGVQDLEPPDALT